MPNEPPIANEQIRGAGQAIRNPAFGVRQFSFPFAILAGYLAFQLLLLAWTAFPEATMKSAAGAGLESWFFLAGGQALFVSWLWPLVRAGGTGRRQATVEAALLAAASVPAAVPAVWWAGATAGQVLAAGGYVAAWLAAGWAVVGLAESGVIRWAYGLCMTLANFGLFGLAYLNEDFLSADPTGFRRFSPMSEAARLAEIGWPAAGVERNAALLPVAALLVLLALAVLVRPGRGATNPGR